MEKKDIKPIEIMGRKFLSSKDAAKILGVSYRTIWRWLKSGKLPSKRIGHRYLIPYDSLARLLLED